MKNTLAVFIWAITLFFPFTGAARKTIDTLLYKTENVHFCNADSGICFGGTLILPDSTRQNPVVIFVSGTGKQDRNGTMAGHKMFKTIAEYLAQKGIASLQDSR